MNLKVVFQDFLSSLHLAKAQIFYIHKLTKNFAINKNNKLIFTTF